MADTGIRSLLVVLLASGTAACGLLGAIPTPTDLFFRPAFREALEDRFPDDSAPPMTGHEFAELVEPLLGFLPVAYCQNNGHDWGGSASESTRREYAALLPNDQLPADLTRFRHTGMDLAAPDGVVVFHFIARDGEVQARSAPWGGDCQWGRSQCSAISNLSVKRVIDPQSGYGIVVEAPGWQQCPFHP